MTPLFSLGDRPDLPRPVFKDEDRDSRMSVVAALENVGPMTYREAAEATGAVAEYDQERAVHGHSGRRQRIHVRDRVRKRAGPMTAVYAAGQRRCGACGPAPLSAAEKNQRFREKGRALSADRGLVAQFGAVVTPQRGFSSSRLSLVVFPVGARRGLDFAELYGIGRPFEQVLVDHHHRPLSGKVMCLLSPCLSIQKRSGGTACPAMPEPGPLAADRTLPVSVRRFPECTPSARPASRSRKIRTASSGLTLRAHEIARQVGPTGTARKSIAPSRWRICLKTGE